LNIRKTKMTSRAGYVSPSNTVVHSSGQVAADLLALAGGRGDRVVTTVNRLPSYDLGTTTVNNGTVSAIESAILRSRVPIDINENEEITVNGQRGIYANRQEILNWRGPVPIERYEINQDPNPEIVYKKLDHNLDYVQNVSVRYLRPPTPPPGEIIIKEESSTATAPAPPLIIRQNGSARPRTPEPIVIREAPPPAPIAPPRKIVTIRGKNIAPPPRKVVTERMASLPPKPPNVIIERWLPYRQAKRRVVYQRANEVNYQVERPRNLIIQWESPQVNVRQEIKYNGVERVDPADYIARYGHTLRSSRDLPSYALEIRPPSEYTYSGVSELEGDVAALRLIDLDREGLGEFRSLVQRSGIADGTSNIDNVTYTRSSYTTAVPVTTNSNSSIIAEIFNSVDSDRNGRLSMDEAQRVFLRLNSRLGRRYDEDDVRIFFDRLDANRDGVIDINEFRRAFESYISTY
jgi:hypothetical protein